MRITFPKPYRAQSAIALTVVAIALLLARDPVFAQSRLPAAHGKNPPRLTMQQLTDRAAVIAVGKVTSLKSNWSDDRKRIVTDATVSVGEYMKGNQPTGTLIVRYLGGEIGAVGELYSETATFKSGEEVMVFASKDKQGHFRVVGGDQGKFTVAVDRMTGKKMVGQGLPFDALKAQVKMALSKPSER
jgi:hypothetical protein